MDVGATWAGILTAMAWACKPVAASRKTECPAIRIQRALARSPAPPIVALRRGGLSAIEAGPETEPVYTR